MPRKPCMLVRVFIANLRHPVGRRGSLQLTLHSCRMRSRLELLGRGGNRGDIAMIG
jgi:hypothetical protein